MFSNKYIKNDKIILKHFQLLKRLRRKKSIILFVVSIENLKTLKYHIFLKKQFFLLVMVSVAVKMKRYLKMKNRLKYEKIIALITLKICRKKTQDLILD